MRSPAAVGRPTAAATRSVAPAPTEDGVGAVAHLEALGDHGATVAFAAARLLAAAVADGPAPARDQVDGRHPVERAAPKVTSSRGPTTGSGRTLPKYLATPSAPDDAHAHAGLEVGRRLAQLHVDLDGPQVRELRARSERQAMDAGDGSNDALVHEATLLSRLPRGYPAGR